MMQTQAQQHSTGVSLAAPPVLATRRTCSVPPQAMAVVLQAAAVVLQAMASTLPVLTTQLARQELGRPSLTRARRHRRRVVTEAR